MSTTSSTRAISFALALASTASAQTSPAALAESLFRDGKKLLDQKNFDEACPKLAESARLDPASGTYLALGICHEGQGRVASAWADFSEAATLAKRTKRADREQAALAKMAALEPKIARVSILVAKETAGLDGLIVKQDNVTVGSAAWSNAPVDPGPHTLEVTAPGKKPYKTTFEIKSAEQKSVAVPSLEDEEKPIPAANPVLVPVVERPGHEIDRGGSALFPVGLVVGGVGLAALGAGAILGGVAIGSNSEAKSLCPMSPCANEEGISANRSAETMADVSTVLFISGGALAATGLVLVLLAPKGKPNAAGVNLSPALSGLVLRGAF